jgi:hypothetical protein
VDLGPGTAAAPHAEPHHRAPHADIAQQQRPSAPRPRPRKSAAKIGHFCPPSGPRLGGDGLKVLSISGQTIDPKRLSKIAF